MHSPDETQTVEVIVYDCFVVDEVGTYSYENFDLIDVSSMLQSLLYTSQR